MLCLFWWNFFLYFICNVIFENCEMVCDDCVVLEIDDVGVYVLMLVVLVE